MATLRSGAYCGLRAGKIEARPDGMPTGLISPRTTAFRACRCSASAWASSSPTAPAPCACHSDRDSSSKRASVRAPSTAARIWSANTFSSGSLWTRRGGSHQASPSRSQNRSSALTGTASFDEIRAPTLIHRLRPRRDPPSSGGFSFSGLSPSMLRRDARHRPRWPTTRPPSTPRSPDNH